MSDSLYQSGLILRKDVPYGKEARLEDMTTTEKQIMNYLQKTHRRVYMFGMPNQYADYCRMMGIQHSNHSLREIPFMKGLSGITFIPVDYQDLDPDVIVIAAIHEMPVVTMNGLEIPRPLSQKDYDYLVEERDNYVTERALYVYAQVEALPEFVNLSDVSVIPNKEGHFVIKCGKRVMVVPNLSDFHVVAILSWLVGRLVTLQPEVAPCEDMRPLTLYQTIVTELEDQIEIKPREPIMIQNRDTMLQVVAFDQVIQTIDVGPEYNNYIRKWKRAGDYFSVAKRTKFRVTYKYGQPHPPYVSHKVTNKYTLFDVLCSLKTVVHDDIIVVFHKWMNIAYELTAYCRWSEYPVFCISSEAELYTISEMLDDPCFEAHARLSTYSSSFRPFIGFLNYGPSGFVVTLGRLKRGSLVLVMPKMDESRMQVRITVENPGAVWTEDITLYCVSMAPVDFTRKDRKCLLPYSAKYTFIEIDRNSFVVDAETWRYVPLLWVNVTLDGKWYGSRPLVYGDATQSALCVDREFYNQSDVSIVSNGQITIGSNKPETRLHVINSKIIF
jgi:hypothetical protein